MRQWGEKESCLFPPSLSIKYGSAWPSVLLPFTFYMWLEFNGDTVLRAARSAMADVHVDGDGYWSIQSINSEKNPSASTTNAGPGGTAGLRQQLAAVVISVIFTATQALGVLRIDQREADTYCYSNRTLCTRRCQRKDQISKMSNNILEKSSLFLCVYMFGSSKLVTLWLASVSPHQ